MSMSLLAELDAPIALQRRTVGGCIFDAARSAGIRLLRQLAEPARERAPPGDRPPDRHELRTQGSVVL